MKPMSYKETTPTHYELHDIASNAYCIFKTDSKEKRDNL
jgi:hypothetical protein